jgi:hypothetical protein
MEDVVLVTDVKGVFHVHFPLHVLDHQSNKSGGWARVYAENLW